MHLPPCMRRAWRRTWSVACRGATARRDAVAYWHRRRRYNGCGSGWKGRQSSLKTAARPRWSCASRTRPPGTRLRSSGPPTKRLHATTSTSPRLPFPSLPDLVCSARQRVAAVSVLAWAAGGVGSAWGGRRGADELTSYRLRGCAPWLCGGEQNLAQVVKERDQVLPACWQSCFSCPCLASRIVQHADVHT